MSLKADILAAKRSVDKLNTYMDGLFATGSREPTEKYYELNRKANDAVGKLPRGFMQTRQGLDFSAAIARRLKG